MKTLRTPDERFDNLPGYSFDPYYLEVDDTEGGRLRIHYLDEGPKNAAPVVLFHGEPTWSYLYRKMIPVLVKAGLRVLAPDLVGFGKSDKPTEKTDYTIERHITYMRSWMQQLDLQNVTFFGQDWGSLIGLSVCAFEQNRIDRIMTANAGLPDPRNLEKAGKVAFSESTDPMGFNKWKQWISGREDLPTGKVMADEVPDLDVKGLGWKSLSQGEKAAYDAPFPDARYQAGALIFPLLALNSPKKVDQFPFFTEAWEIYDHWEKPFLTAYGKADSLLGWFDKIFQENIPGAKGQPHTEFSDGIHFIQEQYGPELAEILIKFIGDGE